jgi:hypothetical protein
MQKEAELLQEYLDSQRHHVPGIALVPGGVLLVSAVMDLQFARGDDRGAPGRTGRP